MKKLPTLFFAAAVLIGLPTILRAEGTADSSLPQEAQEVVQKAALLQTYRTKFALEAKGEKEGENLRIEGTLIFKRPNLRHMELKKSDTGEMQGILVSDGKTEWQYSPAEKVVYRMATQVEVPGPHRPFAETKPETVRFIKRFREGEEDRVQFEAVPLASLIEGAPAPVKKLRVDIGAQDGLVRQFNLLNDKDEVIFSQKYEGIEVGASVMDTDFKFTIPAGVSVVDVPEQPKTAQ